VSATVERLWAAIEPYVAAEGVELDDVDIVGKSPGVVVRVTLDAEPSLDVDRLAALSRGLSRLLDETDPVAGSYTLEVSSPGLERKLRRPRQYEKSVGSLIKVKTRDPVGGASTNRGVLLAADTAGFVVEIDGERREIAYGEVVSAQTVFVWEKAAKPGKR
jgi:ribosome maturation factor RimP